MDAAQRRLCAAVKPGVPYPDLQRQTHLEIGGLLQRHGIVDLSPEAAFEQRVTHAFFPHGVGHLLGLTVHDAGGFSKSERGGTLDKPKGEPNLRLTRPIEEHMVFTVEPGLYFIPLLLDELRAKPAAKSVDWTAGRIVPALRRHPHRGRRAGDQGRATATSRARSSGARRSEARPASVAWIIWPRRRAASRAGRRWPGTPCRRRRTRDAA